MRSFLPNSASRSETTVELNGWVVSAAGLEPATHALKGVAAREINDLEKLT